MFRPLAATLMIVVSPLGWASSAAASTDPVCSFDKGVTLCASTTTAPVGEDTRPGSRPECILVTPITAVTTTFTAHRGETRSSGTEIAAPAPTVIYERGAAVERCTAPAPAAAALSSNWWTAPDGSKFFRYEGRNFAPSQPVSIAVTFTNVGGEQTFFKTLTTFSNGFFGHGEQFHCDYQRAISVTATQGDTVLTTTGSGTDSGACTS